MTTLYRDKIIAIAEQVKANNDMFGDFSVALYAIAFEEGRQAERLECAKLCESTYPEYGGANPYCFETPSECAEAIRARGDSK